MPSNMLCLLAILLLATTISHTHAERQHLSPEYECLIRSSAIEYAAATLPKAVNDVHDALQYQQMCGGHAAYSAHVLQHHTDPYMQPYTDVNDDIVVHVDAELGSNQHAVHLPSHTFKTVEFALAAIRQARHSTAKRYRLSLKAGQTHYLRQPLKLTAADSNLTIKGDRSNSQQAILTTGYPLRNLKWAPSEVSANVLQAQLPLDVNVDNLAAFNSLFVNGKRMVRARYPNADPEYQGLHTPSSTGWIQSAKQWRAPKPPRTPALDIQVKEPTRSRSHFWQHQLGVGGTASEFDPPSNFWSSADPPAGVTYKVPSGVLMHEEDAKPLNTTRVTDADALIAVHAMHCLHWESWVFRVDPAASDWATGDIRFASGGVQGARGCETGAEYWIENILEQLDTPNEFYVDEARRMLFLYPNMTMDELNKAEVIASQTAELIEVAGTGTDPAHLVYHFELFNIQLSYTATSYLLPKSYSVPSGGDWSIQRIGALTLRNTDGAFVSECLFQNLGSNAVLVNGYNTFAGIIENEFTLLGDSAIVLLGETSGIDAYTNLNQPFQTVIQNNHIHEIGVYVKQCAGVFSSLAYESTIAQNVIYNIPRAAVCLNDMFGSMYNVIYGNLLFNTVRESADHGPINSWDRQPYIIADDQGQPTITNDKHSTIYSNFLINAYSSVWPVDHDDGSANYVTRGNLMVAGGKKNYMGHSLTTTDNIYLFPDAIRFGSEDAQGWGSYCMEHVGNQMAVAADGNEDVFEGNTCVMYSEGMVYHIDDCRVLNATFIPVRSGNKFMSAQSQPSYTVSCGGEVISFEKWRTMIEEVDPHIEQQPVTPETVKAMLSDWVKHATSEVQQRLQQRRQLRDLRPPAVPSLAIL